MNELVTSVYSILKDAIDDVAEKTEAVAKVQGKIDSGVYDQGYVHSELMPEMNRLKREVKDAAGIAEEKANAAIDEWQTSVRALDTLNPDDITEGDYRLLTCGLPLSADDVLAILDRAAANRTMQQLAFRYAEVHGLELPRDRVYTSATQDARKADSLREPVHLFVRHWITTDKAASMLQQLLGIAEN